MDESSQHDHKKICEVCISFILAFEVLMKKAMFFKNVATRWFLESISPTLYVRLLRQYFCAKKVQTLNLSTKKFHEKLSYKKAMRKMLVKSTLGGKEGAEQIMGGGRL
jgi:hypothetical protein